MMRRYLDWQACLNDGKEEYFSVAVPGNFQEDYGLQHGYGSVNIGKNVERYKWLEDYGCKYRARFTGDLQPGQRLFFISGGIDYQFTIFLNGVALFAQEGMFTPVELDLTDYLKLQNELTVVIAPPPKRDGARQNDRMQADACVKPAVSYGWDWHPRMIPTGMWEEAYLEVRERGYIVACEAHYTLADDLSQAVVQFDLQCDSEPVITLTAPTGEVVYTGTQTAFTVEHPQLWWCNGQGEPHLYRYCVKTGTHEVAGAIGFRRVELVMNPGTWDEPVLYPKSRSPVPITLCLNGREIFAKGSNWVNPEIFTGKITRETYRPLLEMAQDANMNLLRCWGGAIVNKSAFFELCDELGLMVWQEFPLACNNYQSQTYLPVLEQEAVSIVKRLRRYACVVLWCGGNELFNSWSKMTDQSLALRLLNKVCYEQDRDKPFLATAPLMGMGHGHYVFYDSEWNRDVYEIFNNSKNTAYTEFGVPSISSLDALKKMIPAEEFDIIRPGTAWQTHHGIMAWGPEKWLCMDVLERYFGSFTDWETAIAQSQWLQCEGYKAVFEEARRQKPYCSMALNWCFDEPWPTVGNNSLVQYPHAPKPAYFAVKDALRPVLASARLEKFEYREGELFTAELWLLNDSPAQVEDTICAHLLVDGRVIAVLTWETGPVPCNENKKGHLMQVILPESKDNKLVLQLQSENGFDSTYTLLLKPAVQKEETRQLNV